MNPRYAPIRFGLLLSGIMSFIVSGVATLRALGPSWEMLATWLPTAWLGSSAVAFPSVPVCAPLVRRIVARLTRQAAPHA